MARINPAGQSWGEWFEPRLRATRLSMAAFATRIVEAGGKASKQAVSEWAKGETAAEPNTAVVIAILLGEDPADALRAAGYGIVADAMGGKLHLAGARPEPLDEGIRRILAREGLTPERQARIIENYSKRAALLLDDLDATLDGAVPAHSEPNGESRTA